MDVLGDPVRRRILEMLAPGDLGAGEITAGEIGALIHGEFGISQPAVSQHLRILRESGFVVARAEGTRRLYAVDGAAFLEVESWIRRFSAFWTQPLDALETELVRGRRARSGRRAETAERPSKRQSRRAS